MAHDGPQGIATADDKLNTQNAGRGHYKFGSLGFTKLLEKNKDRIVAVVHGHCHAGAAVDRIGDFKVINPGSLEWAEFGRLRLAKDEETAKWKVSKIDKCYL